MLAPIDVDFPSFVADLQADTDGTVYIVDTAFTLNKRNLPLQYGRQPHLLSLLGTYAVQTTYRHNELEENAIAVWRVQCTHLWLMGRTDTSLFTRSTNPQTVDSSLPSLMIVP